MPSSEPDCQLQQQTSPDQAALYRLNGDYNPLHIDSTVSQEVGFERPILHGLCTFGIAAKHVLQFAEQSGYGNVVSIKVRAASLHSFTKDLSHRITFANKYWLCLISLACYLLTRPPERRQHDSNGTLITSEAARKAGRS